jgi:replicative DNA helicase
MAVDNIDLDILKHMSDRDNYYSNKDIVHKGLCTKESWTLIGDFGRYFKEYPNVTEVDDDFKLWFRVSGHPGWKEEEHKIYGTIINNVLERDPPDSVVFTDQLGSLRFEAEIRKGLGELQKGSASITDVFQRLETTVRHSEEGVGSDSYSLEDLALHQRSDDGLYWRVEDLNQAIGPIRTGDFAVIGKRPEVGGTSFLTSEMSFMLEQMPAGSKAVIFNNEEAPDKVYTRMVSAALDVDYRAMMAAPKLHQQQYEKWLDDKEWKLEHSTSMDLGGIHRVLRESDYGLIGINVLLKVGGTGKKEDHDKFEALGQEMRRIAQEHGPVLAVVQADPSAEGVRYIPQDRIYKSKTALQGEADIQIMIGYDEDGPLDSRYIHVAKNKIPPAPCCDLSCKHIKSEIHFDVGTGRFSSRNYKGRHSCTS